MVQKIPTSELVSAHKELNTNGRRTVRLRGRNWNKVALKDEIFTRACNDDPEALAYAEKRHWELPQGSSVLGAEIAATTEV